MNNIIVMDTISKNQRTKILQIIAFETFNDYNIKNIECDPFAGYITGIVFDTKEDLITFKLKYL